MVHNNRSEGGESQEDSIDDLGAELLKLRVYIIEAVKRRLTKFLELRLNQIIKDIY